jgi:hypothetical protein
MSYTRRYRETVSKTVTVSYSYPASQNGGSGSRTVTVDIPVDVNIHVDTTPFDRSVNNCNGSVNLLTGAVVATEAAQIASIDKNSRKIAGTIVNGFFGYIRSEISQQVMELSQRIDSHLLHLRELAKSCVAKQKQMEVDYHRITDRYIKVFDDLNHELENRIHALDQPAFNFTNHTHTSVASDTDLVSTVAVFGMEGGELQAKISASIAKKRALDTIGRVNTFLLKQKQMQSTINRNMLRESVAAIHYLPVCLLETREEKGKIEKNIYRSAFLSEPDTKRLIEHFRVQNWKTPAKEQHEGLRQHFNSALSLEHKSNDRHGERVRNMMIRLFDVGSTISV